MSDERYFKERTRIEQGHAKYRAKLTEEGKLFVRDRLQLLLDPGTEFQEDFLFARNQEADTPADGVVTGVGTVAGRTVCVMANDYTVKAGSWGEKTVQKIIRIQERAQRLQVPMLYLVDAAGGRISEQIKIFPRRLHARRLFYNEGQLSRVAPPVCILFGPATDEEATERPRRYLSYMPSSYKETPAARRTAAEPAPGRSIDEIVPYD